jgi:hypothetical protein
MSRSHLVAASLRRSDPKPSSLKMALTVIGALFGAGVERRPSR